MMEVPQNQCSHIEASTAAAENTEVNGSKLPCLGTGDVADADDTKTCYLCNYAMGKRQAHIRVPLEASNAATEALTNNARTCHLWCALAATGEKVHQASQQCARNTKDLCASFLDDVVKLVELSPELCYQDPHVRVCYEEIRLQLAARGAPWPVQPLPAPAAATFCFERIKELRISSCPFLRTLPSDIDLCYGMKGLMLISNGLVELPAQLGNLRSLTQVFLRGNFLKSIPQEVGQLPVLKELRLDANQLEEIPAIRSTSFWMLSAPANKLTKVPVLAGALGGIELHGNRLSLCELGRSVSTACWDQMVTLKLMGNRITELPSEISKMPLLQWVNVSENLISCLPSSIAFLDNLEWLYAYSNRLTDVPHGILWPRWLERVLLQANPLQPQAVALLIREAERTSISTLGLDDNQIRAAMTLRMASQARDGAETESNDESWFPTPLPPWITVGQVLTSQSCSGQYYMQLSRASHLKRRAGEPAAGEADHLVGPAKLFSANTTNDQIEVGHVEKAARDSHGGVPQGGCSEGPPASQAQAGLLVVAFAASQGEPEWSGLLQRLSSSGVVRAQAAPIATLEDMASQAGITDSERTIGKLWSKCVAASGCDAGHSDEHAPLPDFDVLTVVDHRMRWYSEEEESLHQRLRQVTSKYKHTLFLGASMGGFGAILHGGRLADSVVAFAPQTVLTTATLRPPGASDAELRGLEDKLQASVQSAMSRGSSIRIHCAADEHLGHALSLPMEDLAITVHPILPRRPLGRLLDSAGILEPIIGDAIHSLLYTPDACAAMAASSAGARESVVCVASWTQEGRFDRYRATRTEVLQLFFGTSTCGQMPRPGDWFCPTCLGRYSSDFFFCERCSDDDATANIANPLSARVLGGNVYPKSGDWGCKTCFWSHHRDDQYCEYCGIPKDGPDAFIAA